MKQIFDTNGILYTVLSGNAELRAAIDGGVYVQARPLNSRKVDVVVNTIALTQESLPQIGASNVNVHVPDVAVNTGGVSQKMPNMAKLSQVSTLAMAALRAAKVPGLAFSIETQSLFAEPETEQHFANIRIIWNIQD